MDYEIDVSLQAECDADEVFNRIARQTPRTAERWLEGLFKSIDALMLFPERCSLAPESDAFNEDVRQHFYGKRNHRYRILFVIRGNMVRVLRIVHGARRTLRPDQL